MIKYEGKYWKSGSTVQINGKVTLPQFGFQLLFLDKAQFQCLSEVQFRIPLLTISQ